MGVDSFFSFFDKKAFKIVLSSKEKELLDLLKKDDQSAIKILFESYHSILCLLAYRLVKDQAITKDIVQEVFIKFWNIRKNIDITTSIAAYLKRSVVNTSLNYLEKDKRYSKIQIEQLSKHPQAYGSDQEQSLKELSMQVEGAINKLPVRTRAVFILIRNEEMTYKEAATTLDISAKAVEKEMMKALKLLREMLKHFLAVILLGNTII